MAYFRRQHEEIFNDEILNAREREPSIIELWHRKHTKIYDRFMITWCPELCKKDKQRNLIANHLTLKEIFKDARKYGIEAEFTVEYGNTDRLHYHIIIMCRNKSSYYSFNRCIYYKLGKVGFLKKSPYHENLKAYLNKEKAVVGLLHPNTPTHFSIETLERF